MPRHWHTSADVIILTALGTALAFHAFRFLGGKLAKNTNGAPASLGRGVLGLFSFGSPS